MNSKDSELWHNMIYSVLMIKSNISKSKSIGYKSECILIQYTELNFVFVYFLVYMYLQLVFGDNHNYMSPMWKVHILIY